MPTILPNGVGALVGPSTVTAHPSYLSGNLFFVDSQTGLSGNTGRDRNHPLDTLQAAVTAATTGSKIVMLSGHTEEISASISLAGISVQIVGEGSASGVPTVELTLPAGSTSVFSVNTAALGLRLENIVFKPPGNAAAPGASTGSFILGLTGSDSVVIAGCRFEYDSNMNAAGVVIPTACDAWRFENCVFVSTETSLAAADRPFTALTTANTTTLVMEGVTFDGGVSGFESGSATPEAFLASVGVAGLQVQDLTLLRGADFRLSSSTVGFIDGAVATGSAQIIWPD